MNKLDENFYIQQKLSTNLLYAQKEYDYLLRKQERLAERKVELEQEIKAIQKRLTEFE